MLMTLLFLYVINCFPYHLIFNSKSIWWVAKVGLLALELNTVQWRHPEFNIEGGGGWVNILFPGCATLAPP